MSTPGITSLAPAAPPQQFKLRELPNGVRVFDNAKIQGAIDSALAAMGPDDRFATVAHHVYRSDGTKVENVTKLSVVVKVKGGFSIAAGAYKDWTSGDQGAEGKIVFKG